jgi:hypothetical protein
MNYFVVHPTAVPFVLDTTANTAYSAIIIGAPTISAIVISLIHCHVLSEQTSMGRRPDQKSLRLFRNLFFFSAFAAIVGNIVHARGIAHESIPHAVLGRFLLGFASSDIVQRQFIGSLMPLPLIAAESARLAHVQIVGQLVGLLFGSLVAWTGVLASGNWFMALFWIAYCIFVACNGNSDSRNNQKKEQDHAWEILENKDVDVDVGNESDSSGSDEKTGGPAQLFQRSSYVEDIDEDAERSQADEKTGLLVSKVPSERPKKSVHSTAYSRPPKGFLKRFRTFTKRIRKLMAYNISIPITLALILYCKFSTEAFISSSPLLGYHYFDWTGQRSGCFLAFLSVLIVPTDFISEQIARRYEERTILKVCISLMATTVWRDWSSLFSTQKISHYRSSFLLRSCRPIQQRGIVILGIGLFIMINWGSIFGLLPEIQNLLDEDQNMRRHEYDWFLGIFQYVGGLTVSIVVLRSIDVASCSLLSKVAPAELRNIAINVGTIATFVGLVGQLAADLQIAAVVLSHRLINSDVVNALVIPILLSSFIVYYFVRKHFFFLM